MSRVVAYASERFPLRVFVPAWCLLVTAAWASARPHTVASLAHTAVLMALLIAEFRIWDDLEDRNDDRRRCPDRVLVAGSAAPFYAVAGVLCLSAVVAVVAKPAALFGLVALHGGAWVAYRHVRAHVGDHAWRYAVLPLKYPAFVVVVTASLAHSSAPIGLASAVLAYAGAAGYEIASDRAMGAI